MAAAAREYFTVDLRGLRAALAARAVRDDVTESDVLRSALAVALGIDRSVPVVVATRRATVAPARPHVKVSIRLPMLTSSDSGG